MSLFRASLGQRWLPSLLSARGCLGWPGMELTERPGGQPQGEVWVRQEKKALTSRGWGLLKGFLELRRPWGFFTRQDEDLRALPLCPPLTIPGSYLLCPYWSHNWGKSPEDSLKLHPTGVVGAVSPPSCWGESVSAGRMGGAGTEPAGAEAGHREAAPERVR